MSRFPETNLATLQLKKEKELHSLELLKLAYTQIKSRPADWASDDFSTKNLGRTRSPDLLEAKLAKEKSKRKAAQQQSRLLHERVLSLEAQLASLLTHKDHTHCYEYLLTENQTLRQRLSGDTSEDYLRLLSQQQTNELLATKQAVSELRTQNKALKELLEDSQFYTITRVQTPETQTRRKKPHAPRKHLQKNQATPRRARSPYKPFKSNSPARDNSEDLVCPRYFRTIRKPNS